MQGFTSHLQKVLKWAVPLATLLSGSIALATGTDTSPDQSDRRSTYQSRRVACGAPTPQCRKGYHANKGCPAVCVRDQLACPEIARICPDGKIAKYVRPGVSCQTTCAPGAVQCGAPTPICPDGFSLTKGCPQQCVRQLAVCPAIARVCPDGSAATYINAHSCQTACSKNPSPLVETADTVEGSSGVSTSYEGMSLPPTRAPASAAR